MSENLGDWNKSTWNVAQGYCYANSHGTNHKQWRTTLIYLLLLTTPEAIVDATIGGSCIPPAIVGGGAMPGGYPPGSPPGGGISSRSLDLDRERRRSWAIIKGTVECDEWG